MKKEYGSVYFLGIGGIGMSAIARWFMHGGRRVAGYDRTRTPLTAALEGEGAEVHYTDDPALIPQGFRDPASTLVVYTPAIPPDSREAAWFDTHGFERVKRSQMLGHISEGYYVMAVAGTHGKTTTSTLAAWLNSRAASSHGEETGGGSAFLGGISVNFGSNLVLGVGPRLVVEADEFDRSFLQLSPDAAVITSADADHLDIYGTHDEMRRAFSAFVDRIKPGGALAIKKGVGLEINNKKITVYRYSFDEPCDFYATGVRLLEGGRYRFDIVCPDRTIQGCTLGIPGWINVENAVAATALMWVAGFDEQALKVALAEFEGVKRRFEVYIDTPGLVYIDDYAHHPRELAAAIGSIRAMYPGRHFTAVFQPHLYTRTKDFYREFGEALSLADEVVLLPIYPAREEPVEGVDSGLIARHTTAPCTQVDKEAIADHLARCTPLDIVATFGAGDIDAQCARIAEALRGRK